jgi:hypothetical protein
VQRFVTLAILGVGLLVTTRAAQADHTMIVPRSESTAHWGTRKQVEATVLELAQRVDRGAAQTETPFAELAAATGCKGGVVKCKDAVLEAIDVDELVLIKIESASADHVRVTVRRASRRGVTAGTVVVPVDAPEAPLRAGLASLFGLSAREAAKPTASARKPAVTAPNSGVKRATVSPEKARAMAALQHQPPQEDLDEPPTEPTRTTRVTTPAPTVDREPALVAPPEKPAPVKPAPVVAPPAVEESAPTAPTVTAAPDNVVDDDRPAGRYRTLYLGGVIGGGALALIGVVLWAQAAGIESDLRDAPDETSADVQRILDLEARGDRYALWGNVTFVAGVAVAGATGFLLWRDVRRGHRAERSARLAPIVFDHGAGVSLSFGADR